MAYVDKMQEMTLALELVINHCHDRIDEDFDSPELQEALKQVATILGSNEKFRYAVSVAHSSNAIMEERHRELIEKRLSDVYMEIRDLVQGAY